MEKYPDLSTKSAVTRTINLKVDNTILKNNCLPLRKIKIISSIAVKMSCSPVEHSIYSKKYKKISILTK
ncbi:MAG: hypothetical protein Q8903_03960 [Bacteroidota bacterium]|nr:hypothetical protein [Bacteroidota bacterium]